MSVWRGDKLKEAREAAMLSRLNLATQLDVTQARVEEWEEGRLVPSGQVLADLADAVGLNLTELFEPEPKGNYRTHSRVSGTSFKQFGDAEDEAEYARLRGDFTEAERDYESAVRAYRAADPWDNSREAQRMHAAGSRLAALRAKLIAHDMAGSR